MTQENWLFSTKSVALSQMQVNMTGVSHVNQINAPQADLARACYVAPSGDRLQLPAGRIIEKTSSYLQFKQLTNRYIGNVLCHCVDI